MRLVFCFLFYFRYYHPCIYNFLAIFQLLARQLVYLFEEVEDQRRHSLEVCVLLENENNYPRDSRNLVVSAQRAVQALENYFNYRLGFGEMMVVHSKVIETY